MEPYPGMGRETIIQRAAELGYNSFRIRVPSDPDQCITFMHQLLDEAEEYYLTHLVHGHRRGWDRMECTGSGDPEMCNLVWSLSDIIDVDSRMKMPETDWLLSVANRYGRPVVCTQWAPPGGTVSATLELFSWNMVYWYSVGPLTDCDLLKDFGFTRIAAPFRYGVGLDIIYQQCFYGLNCLFGRFLPSANLSSSHGKLRFRPLLQVGWPMCIY